MLRKRQSYENLNFLKHEYKIFPNTMKSIGESGIGGHVRSILLLKGHVNKLKNFSQFNKRKKL